VNLAAGHAQNFSDVACDYGIEFKRFISGSRWVYFSLSCRCGTEIVESERLASVQDHGALDHVLQFAHVAGPGISHQVVYAAGRQARAQCPAQ